MAHYITSRLLCPKGTSKAAPEGAKAPTPTLSCYAGWDAFQKKKLAFSPLGIYCRSARLPFGSFLRSRTKADDAIYAFLFVPFGEQHLKVQYARSSAIYAQRAESPKGTESPLGIYSVPLPFGDAEEAHSRLYITSR